MKCCNEAVILRNRYKKDREHANFHKKQKVLLVEEVFEKQQSRQ